MKFSRWGSVGLLLILLTSCGLLERRVRVVGEIDSFSQQDAIIVPASVQSRESFEVTVTTLGGGCMDQGETDVQVQGLRADITPYDYAITPLFGACLLYGEEYLHTTTLTFAEKGTATLFFHGRELTTGKAGETTQTRTLTVC